MAQRLDRCLDEFGRVLGPAYGLLDIGGEAFLDALLFELRSGQAVELVGESVGLVRIADPDGGGEPVDIG